MTPRDNALTASVVGWLDGLVHPTAREDADAFVRHRAFIASRLLPGVAALSALPVYLAVLGAPGLIGAMTFASLILPLVIAFLLSRTGDFEKAHILSAVALTVVATVIAALTGGLASFAIIWLALVPAEAVLSQSRRVVVIAGGIVAAAVVTLGLQTLSGVLPETALTDRGMAIGALVSTAWAMVYAILLALSATHVGESGEAAKSVGERRYRLLAEHMTDLITRHGRNGAVTFASPAAERLAGVMPYALHGHGLFDRVHVADRPAYLTALSSAAVRGEETSVEFRLKRAGEDQRADSYEWVEMRCRPLSASGSDDGQVVSVLRDITERKSHEAEVERARAEADRANEAKSRFLANVSHELRTPLNAIIGFSEMLTQDELLRLEAEKRREYAGLIRDSGEHLLNLVNSILDLSKIESGNFEITAEPFSLRPLLDHCVQMMGLKAEESGIRLTVSSPAMLPELVADKRACRQIMLNLLSNAIKFTKAGGTVTTDVRLEGQTVAIAVADTGIGVSREDLERLGRPFFQARSAYDRPHEGTGLGLSVVKGLVELHGGRVDFASTPGVGTTVTVRLPVDCEAARAVPQGGVIENLTAVRAARAPVTDIEERERKRA